jgi:hypothetical protein
MCVRSLREGPLFSSTCVNGEYQHEAVVRGINPCFHKGDLLSSAAGDGDLSVAVAVAVAVGIWPWPM